MTRRRWLSLTAISVLVMAVLGSAAVSGGSLRGLGQVSSDRTVANRPPASPASAHLCRVREGPDIPAGYVSVGFPVSPLRAASRGAVRVPVIFVDFPDSRSPAATPRSEWSELRPAQQYLRDVSYGRMDITFEPLLRWVHLPRPAASYGISRAASPSTQTLADYLRAAVRRADRHVDFSGVSSVLVVINRETTAIDYSPALVVTSASEGIATREGSVITSGAALGADTWWAWGWRVIPHEFGHALGLADLYDGSTSDYARLHRYVGTWDLMGDIEAASPEYLAWNRWLLRWVRDEQVRCLVGPTVDATVTLTAVERKRGIKAVVVRLGPTRALVMESRRALRHDAVVSDTRVPPDEGVLVYVVDTAIDTLHGPIRVLARDRESGRGDKSRAPLGPGESLTYAGVTVTVVSAQAIHDTVTVKGVPQDG